MSELAVEVLGTLTLHLVVRSYGVLLLLHGHVGKAGRQVGIGADVPSRPHLLVGRVALLREGLA